MANPNIVSVTGITAGTLGWNLPTGGLVNLIDPDTGYLLKINRIVVANVDGSAVNQLTYANAAADTNPSFTATGDSTNIGINFVPKGSGAVQAAGSDLATVGKAIAMAMVFG